MHGGGADQDAVLVLHAAPHLEAVSVQPGQPHPELYKKTLGVIGLGAIGALVCNIALDLGMDVYGYDPFLSVDRFSPW